MSGQRPGQTVVERPFKLWIFRTLVAFALLVPVIFVATRPEAADVRLGISAAIGVLILLGWLVIGRLPHEWRLDDERAEMRDFAGVREIVWDAIKAVRVQRLPEAGRCLVIAYDEPDGAHRQFYLPLWLVRAEALAVLLGRLRERVPADRVAPEVASL